VSAPAELVELVDVLLEAAESRAGGVTVAAHDEDYELFLRGNDSSLVLSMRGGTARIVSAANPGFCSYTRATIDADVVPEIAAGRLTPTEAVEEGRILLQSRLYGGGQLLRLMRIAQLEGAFGGL
jgi:hypothetical protein